MKSMYPGWSTMFEDDEREILEYALHVFSVHEGSELDPSPYHRRRSSAAARLQREIRNSSFLRVNEFDGRVVRAALAALEERDPVHGAAAAALRRRLPRG